MPYVNQIPGSETGVTPADVAQDIGTHAGMPNVHHAPPDVSGKADTVQLADLFKAATIDGRVITFTQFDDTTVTVTVPAQTGGLADGTVTAGSYNPTTQVISLTEQGGTTIEINVNQLVNGDELTAAITAHTSAQPHFAHPHTPAPHTHEVPHNSVGSRQLQEGAVTTDILADNSVTGSKLARNVVDQAHLAADSVGASELRSDAVGTDEIQDNAVTEAKLAPAVRDQLGGGGTGGGGLSTVSVGDGLTGDGSAADPIEIVYEDADFGIRNVRNVRGETEARLGLSTARRDEIEGAATTAALNQETTQRQAGDTQQGQNLSTHASGPHVTAAEQTKLGKYPASANDGQVVTWSQARNTFVGGNLPPPTVSPAIESILLPAKNSPSLIRRASGTITWTIAEIRTVEADFNEPSGDYILSASLSDRSEFSVEHVEWDSTNDRVEVTIRNVNGENRGDIYSGRVTLNILRGTPSPTQSLTRADVRTEIESEVFAQALQGNADGWPGTKTFDGLFKDSGQENLAGASATIAFNIPENVQDTEAAGTSFVLTAQQVNEPAAFITAAYTLSGVTSTGNLPTDLELLLQVRDTGAILDTHNLKIIASGSESGHVHFSTLGDAGAKRWAIRVGDGHGGYRGTLAISEVQYHAGEPLANDAVKRIVAPELSAEKDERQRDEAILREGIEEAKGIVAITDALPQPSNVQRKTTPIVWRTSPPWRQAESDALQAPATGFAQVILGNVGATAIMPVEYCVNRKEIIYAQDTTEVSVNWDSQRRAIIEARTGEALSLLGTNDITNTVTGLVLVEYNRARRGGTDTGSPSWERVLGLQETLPNSRDNAVRQDIGVIMLPRAAFPQVWDIAGVAEVKQNDESDDIRRFNCRLSFASSGTNVVHKNETGDVIGNGLGEEHLMDHFLQNLTNNDPVWRATEWDNDNIRNITVTSGSGALPIYVFGNLTGQVRNIRIFTRVIA